MARVFPPRAGPRIHTVAALGRFDRQRQFCAGADDRRPHSIAAGEARIGPRTDRDGPRRGLPLPRKPGLAERELAEGCPDFALRADESTPGPPAAIDAEPSVDLLDPGARSLCLGERASLLRLSEGLRLSPEIGVSARQI